MWDFKPDLEKGLRLEAFWPIARYWEDNRLELVSFKPEFAGLELGLCLDFKLDPPLYTQERGEVSIQKCFDGMRLLITSDCGVQQTHSKDLEKKN